MIKVGIVDLMRKSVGLFILNVRKLILLTIMKSNGSFYTANQWIDIENKEKSTMAILTNHENEKPGFKSIKIKWYLNDIESRKIENRQEILIQNKINSENQVKVRNK